MKLFDDKQIGDYVLQTPKTDHGYFRFWNVIRDIKSEYVHSNDMPCEQMLKYRGLQIDIFPMLERYSRSLKIKLYGLTVFLGRFCVYLDKSQLVIADSG